MYDYFVIGSGLAGICFSETALQNNKSVFVFGNSQKASSRVAVGIFNAVILKRFTLTDQAQTQINLLQEFYPKIETKLGVKLLYDMPIYRKLTSLEEQNNFILTSDRPLFQNFLTYGIVFQKHHAIDAPFGFGKVKQTGYINTSVLVDSYAEYLKTKEIFSEDWFDYSKVKITGDYISYKEKKAKNIVFCEGMMLKNNPFFGKLPLDGAKGELLVIEAKDLKMDFLLKAGLFVLPMRNHKYKVGATYNWTDKTDLPTREAKTELVSELKKIISCEFNIIEHLAGIRPTVRDRKPLVGQHHLYKNMYLLNGLGTRGVMLAPYLSKNLFNFIEFRSPLSHTIDINRYSSLFS